MTTKGESFSIPGLHCFGERQAGVWILRGSLERRRRRLAGSPAVPGFRKTLLLDDAGHVLHVERTLPPEVAKKLGEASFVALEFAPVVLGAQTVWLPARLDSHDVKDENRLEVRYSGCRLFGGSMTILPGADKVPEP